VVSARKNIFFNRLRKKVMPKVKKMRLTKCKKAWRKFKAYFYILLLWCEIKKKRLAVVRISNILRAIYHAGAFVRQTKTYTQKVRLGQAIIRKYRHKRQRFMITNIFIYRHVERYMIESKLLPFEMQDRIKALLNNDTVQTNGKVAKPEKGKSAAHKKKKKKKDKAITEATVAITPTQRPYFYKTTYNMRIKIIRAFYRKQINDYHKRVAKWKQSIMSKKVIDNLNASSSSAVTIGKKAFGVFKNKKPKPLREPQFPNIIAMRVMKTLCRQGFVALRQSESKTRKNVAESTAKKAERLTVLKQCEVDHKGMVADFYTQLMQEYPAHIEFIKEMKGTLVYK